LSEIRKAKRQFSKLNDQK